MNQFEVELPGPLDIDASLETFRRSGDDYLDRWDGTCLIRTLPVEREHVMYICRPSGTIQAPRISVEFPNAALRPLVEAAVRSTFLPEPACFRELLRVDPVLARLDARFPGLRAIRYFDLYHALVRSISAQQVNLSWAATTRRRLAEAFGERHVVGDHFVFSLSAPRLAAASVSEIRALQFTTRKAEYLIEAADAVASGRLCLRELLELPDHEAIRRLTAVRGVGLWTAEWIVSRVLGRPRVVAGDLGVRKAVGKAYLKEPLPSESAVRAATAHWQEAAELAQVLILRDLN